MKKIKVLLRYWIAAATVAGFLFGWITFAHSAKTVSISGQTSQSTSSSTTSLTAANAQTIVSLPQSQSAFQPRLRTGGS